MSTLGHSDSASSLASDREVTHQSFSSKNLGCFDTFSTASLAIDSRLDRSGFSFRSD